MDPSTSNSHPQSTIFAKTLHKVKTARNPGFCLLIPPPEKEKFGGFSEMQKQTYEASAAAAFIAKLFASVSAFKAAYAELQLAQFPYDAAGVQLSDQLLVDELKSISELKQSFLKKQIDFSSPHVTLMLAEIQEQQSLMKTYEITIRKLRMELESMDARVYSLRERLDEENRKLDAVGAISLNYSPSKLTPKGFIFVLNYCLRSVRCFAKLLIREMEQANWDVQSAAHLLHPNTVFLKRNHLVFVFESFICREIFSGFNDTLFWYDNDSPTQESLLNDENVMEFLKKYSRSSSSSSSSFGKFLKCKYLDLIHPKMEFSFFGNLNQRKMVDSGEFPETEFFEAFSEMGRRVWVLNCLALRFDDPITPFQVRRNTRFSEVYMESVTGDVVGSDLKVAFTVVPGFKMGNTVVQSKVFLLNGGDGSPHAPPTFVR